MGQQRKPVAGKKQRKAAKPRKPIPAFALSVTPVPQPLHRCESASCLEPTRLAKLRQSIIDERGHRCETCGTQVETIYAHEEWAYDTKPRPAVATVKRITLTCWHCHQCEHFLHAVSMCREGSLSEAALHELMEHFCMVNETDEATFMRHVDEAIREWNKLSKLKWRVDFRPYAGLYPVQVVEGMGDTAVASSGTKRGRNIKSSAKRKRDQRSV